MTKDHSWKKAEKLLNKRALLSVKAHANDKMADWYDKDPDFKSKVDTLIRMNKSERTGQAAAQVVFGLPGSVLRAAIMAPINAKDPIRKEIANKASEAFDESRKELLGGSRVSDKERYKYSNHAGYDISRGKDSVKVIKNQNYSSNSKTTSGQTKANTTKSESQKKEALSRAKNKGMYDMTFLETVQNKNWYNNDNKMLSEYSKYLNDPEKYVSNR